ncbi:MAG TPA: gamma carbonic anhydrase family protein [Polyangiaceae bacterium]|jgi:carbonic anhydrase/acetyltransferase-like protein (isoleucine patch superfamily)|nr:gamma carbonic anhydrase family protein [Polyangiaceae bacterium]
MAVIRAFGTHSPRFGARVFIADTASVLGDVELADDVSLWFGAVLRGDVGCIRVGARTNIQDNACIHMTHEVSDALIGADVIVGHSAVLHGARVEDGALIGMSAVVMDNAVIGAGAWVAAGSVVPPRQVVPPHTLVRGSPAKVVREVSPDEVAWAAGAVQRYLALAEEHKAQQHASGIFIP